MSRVKELSREVKLLNLTEKYNFNLSVNNLIEHNYNSSNKRYKIFGLPIGKKYKSTQVSTNIKIFECVNFLLDNFDVIITGSCALKIYGLLERDINCDIDIIADQKTIDELAVKYQEYTYHIIYGDKPDLNYIKSFVINGIKVDTFLNTGQKFQILGNVKVNEPFEVINMKLNLNRIKDFEDTKNFIKLINSKKI